jgi:hypothetical protein
MSLWPRFRGKKGQIVERLHLGESSKAIATALDTSEGYVHNVRSLLKMHGIVFTPSQTTLQDTPSPDVTNANPQKIEQAGPSAVNPSAHPSTPEPNSGIEIVKTSGTPSVNRELESMRRGINGIEREISEKEEALALKRKKQELLKKEQRLSNEVLLQKFVFDICPDIREMWNNKRVYIQVMSKIFQIEPFKTIYTHIVAMRVWSGEQADGRLPVVLEQIFDNTTPEFKTKRLNSGTILSDSIEEFIDYFNTCVPCPYDRLPALPSENPGYWRCAENHVFLPPDVRRWNNMISDSRSLMVIPNLTKLGESMSAT